MSRVAIVRCKTYEPLEVQGKVKEAIDLIGGITSHIKEGARVFIKPNQLSDRPPKDGVVTHPEFLRALIKVVKERTKNISIGDSPSGAFKQADNVYEKSGLKRVAEEEGINLVKFESAIECDGITIAKPILDADVVINAPKMKTHGLTTITCAVKNMFGCVPGPTKINYHLKYPNVRDFAKQVVEVFSRVKPQLTVVDGIVAMEGDGPANGPLKDAGLILAGADAVSVDAVISSIIGVKPESVNTTRIAHERGLGEMNLKKIEVVGERLDDARLKGFKLPKGSFANALPGGLGAITTRLVRFYPQINEELCKKCNLCIKACPKNSILITKDISKIDKKVCINCLCCMEVCPYKAIFLAQNWLARKLIW